MDTALQCACNAQVITQSYPTRSDVCCSNAGTHSSSNLDAKGAKHHSAGIVPSTPVHARRLHAHRRLAWQGFSLPREYRHDTHCWNPHAIKQHCWLLPDGRWHWPTHMACRLGQSRPAGSVPSRPGLCDRYSHASCGLAPGSSQAGGNAGPVSWLEDTSRRSNCSMRDTWHVWEADDYTPPQ